MVRFICLEMEATGVFARECFFKSRTSALDHSRRFERAFFPLPPVFDFLSSLRVLLAMCQFLDSFISLHYQLPNRAPQEFWGSSAVELLP